MNRPEDVPDRIVAALDRLERGARSHRQALASTLGLTALQLDLLRTIAAGPPPDPVAGRLATELGVSQPTVSDSVLTLERKGHLTRTPSTGDRRRTVIWLTDSGRALVARAEEAQEVLRRSVADLPPADQDRLLSVLLELIGNLLEAGIIKVARTCTTCRFYEPTPTGAVRCGLLRVELAPADLRVNCAEHEPRPAP